MHTIPYLGAAAVTAAVGLVAFLQFDSVSVALMAAAVPLAAAAVIGIWLQTALMGRAARMNAVVVFVALLFWGMVWGGWGLLLAFPIMASIKIIFSEIERLRPIALLMSD
jgi:predicted PurR-regulated permease PerM